jgi:hypothetical protein
LRIEGTRHDARKFRDWFALSIFAEAGREAPGRRTGHPAGRPTGRPVTAG